MGREKVINQLDVDIQRAERTGEMLVYVGRKTAKEVLSLLKEQEAKQYNNHEVACILADLFGDTCACNFNDIDTWLPYKCDFRETCCPNPVGVACWEQYLKHKEGSAK